MPFRLLAALVLAPLSAQDLAGRWAGRLEPGRLSAEIKLELARSGSTWRAELSFRAGPDGGALGVEELSVGAEFVSLRTAIEGAAVSIELALDGALLLGSVRASEDGRVLAEGPAGLAPAGDAAAAERLTRWLDGQGDPIDADARGAVIERALDLVLANYVFADRAERAAADVRARARRGDYDGAGTAARFAELLGRHLAEATADRHVQVRCGSERAPDPLAAPAETAEELERLRRDAEADRFGIGDARVLDGNVGVLELRRFCRAEWAGGALAAAMEALAGTDALIVDLRECRGGDPAMVALAASWFFDGRPRHWNDLVRRCDATTTQYWTAAWLPGRRYVAKPLCVLTAARTFSAPESLAYELQQTGRATLVGETTGGGAHSGAWFPLDERFSIFIPLSRYVSAVSGGDWEGIGVAPDVACAASEALARAQREALAALAVRTPVDDERR